MEHDLRDDIELVARTKRGDRLAFGTLIERHQRRAFTVARSILRNRDDAMDVCQDAFIRAHHSLATFDGRAQFSTWLYRIVVNLCFDLLRRRRVVLIELDETRNTTSLGSPLLDPEHELANKQLRDALSVALDELSPAHRAVLILREVTGLSYAEIAVVTEQPVGTVMSRLFHARRRAQAALLAPRPIQRKRSTLASGRRAHVV